MKTLEHSDCAGSSISPTGPHILSYGGWMWLEVCTATCNTHRAVTKAKQSGTITAQQPQLSLKQIFHQCPKQAISSNLNPHLTSFLFITELLIWDGILGQLPCISSLLLLRVSLCHNIVFRTLLPATAHPSFFIIASNKY